MLRRTPVIATRGHPGALLELGAGFDPELSGRQNIRISAGLMGWDAARIAERFEQIIQFADIGSYIDEPVKHYSSGMTVRLGFAIIAAIKPDLLITDEVLAVGDESFQKNHPLDRDSRLRRTLLLVPLVYHVQSVQQRWASRLQGRA